MGDYCAHMCHSFSVQDRTLSRSERAVAALFEIGAPVAVGVLTTGLSVFPLAFAISETYRTFFKIGITMCIIGGLHGLVFCPVLLSFIGPQLTNRAMRFHDQTSFCEDDSSFNDESISAVEQASEKSVKDNTV